VDTLDKNKLTAMLQRHVPKTDILIAFDLTEEELDEFCQANFHKYFDEFERQQNAIGRIALRTSQWAHGGSGMLRFLGEQHLGQRQKIDISGSVSTTGVIRGNILPYEELKALRDAAKDQGTQKP